MKTDELIQSLSGDLPRIAPGAVARRVALGLGLGAVASIALMLVWLGPRPDIAQAVFTPMFWMKLGYAAVTGLILAVLLTRLGKPAARPGALVAIAAAPFAVVAIMGIMRFMQAPVEDHEAMLMGHSSVLCPCRILAIGLPILVGAVWALRGLAPTRLTFAGLVAGGCAGGIGAAVYAVACNETSAPFLAIWYTAGIVAVTAVGGLGSRLLRWR